MAFVAPLLPAASAARTSLTPLRPRPPARRGMTGALPAVRALAADGAPPPRDGRAISDAARVEWLAPVVAVRGAVQRGFGRGSRQLGTPTANLPGGVVRGVAGTARDGVYCGFGVVPAQGGRVVKMVANLGWNITFGDVQERVLEAYLMDDALADEFYGDEMRLCIVAYMRPELKFSALDDLVANIRNDIRVASALLDAPEARAHMAHASLLGE